LERHPVTQRWTGVTLSAAVRAFIAEARVGRLATVNGRGRPSVVPICFALLDGPEPIVVSVLDDKPKRVGDQELARVRNLRQNPVCSLVIDHYEEDWTNLVFTQINGPARIVDSGDDPHAGALAALQVKYPQYRVMDLNHRPVIVIEIVSVTTWRGDGKWME
jgi:PPOX class probable F420-dependent enzyme